MSLTSVAQWEREATGERTREALAHLKAGGVQLGGPALGWERSEQLDGEGRRATRVVPGEVATVARIRELKAAGLSHRAIARTLDVEGRSTKRGGRWSHKQVGKVLRRIGRKRDALEPA